MEQILQMAGKKMIISKHYPLINNQNFIQLHKK